MSNNNLSDFVVSFHVLEKIYRNLWKMQGILNLFEETFVDTQDTDAYKICCALVDLVEDTENLLPEI